MGEGHMKQDHFLLSVKNALKILRAFSFEEPERGIRELSKSLGIGKSTVQRLIYTLASEGYVTQNRETKKYRLGIPILSLGTIVTSHLEIHREALPFLKTLVNRFQESAHISVLNGYEVVYLHKVDSTHPIRIDTHVGKSNPAHCTGSGKVLLAYKSDDFIDHFIKATGLPPYTEHTLSDPVKFKQHLRMVRQKGYAINDEEFADGIVSIAAPIRDYTGEVVSAINLVGPKERIKQNNMPLYIKEIVRYAKEISENLGYYG